MIDCANCRYCTSFSADSEAYKVKCTLFGEQKVSMDFKDTFNCKEFSEKEPIKEPEKENVMIVLKSGRDYFFYDEGVDSLKVLSERMDQALKKREFIQFGNFIANPMEIAAFAYVGE